MEEPLQNNVQTVLDGTNVDDAVCTSMQKETDISEKEVSDVDADDTESALRNIHCDPCKYDGTEEDATGFCVACTDYLCQNCQRDHKKNKLTRNHTLLLDDNIPKDSAAFRAIKDHMMCSKHPGYELSFECVAHNVVICALCLAQYHRHCVDIVDMETYEGHSTAIVADSQQITDLIDRLREYKKKKMDEVDEIGKQHENIQQQCNALVEKWKKHIDNLGIFLLNEADTCSQQEIKCAKDCLSECTDLETFLDTHEEIVSTLTLYGSKKEVAVVSRSLTEKLAMCEGLLNKTQNTKPKKLVLQKVSPATVSSIGSVSVKGSLAVVPKKTNGASVQNDNKSVFENTSPNVSAENLPTESPAGNGQELDTTMFKETHKPLSVKIDKSKLRLISTKSVTDTKPCSICAITKLLDGGIVVADDANKKLKLLTGDFKLVSETKLPSVPADICSKGNSVFVCFPDLKKIYKYQLTLVVFHEAGNYATKHLPVSLSVFDDKSLIILFKKESKQASSFIEVREGTVIKEKLTHSGAKKFDSIKDATQVVCYGDSTLVMAENDKISCYRVDKKLVCKERLWVYTPPNADKLKTPRGLICNASGNLFVCGEKSNNVHMVSAKEEIVSNINKPLCVLVEDKKLVVGFRNYNNLHVYDIE